MIELTLRVLEAYPTISCILPLLYWVQSTSLLEVTKAVEKLPLLLYVVVALGWGSLTSLLPYSL